MNDIPALPAACPRCGAPVELKAPERRTDAGGWEAELLCANGHQLQWLAKPKHRPDAAG